MIDTEKSLVRSPRRMSRDVGRKTVNRRAVLIKALRIAFTLILLVLLCFAGLLEFLTLSEYKPPEKETIDVDNAAGAGTIIPGSALTVMTWNSGYAALGDNADYYMEGGESVQTADHDRVINNLQGIANEIAAINPDVLFLQEVDRDSTRSHRINEEIWLSNTLLEQRGTGYSTAFAYNYKVAYVPRPIPPLGRVQSGLMIFTKLSGAQGERIQLPNPFRWPVRLDSAKRCLLVERIPVSETSEEDAGKELVLINLQLEEYDDSEGKAAQTQVLRQLLEQEAQKGNYVIAGGDFAQVFSNVDAARYEVREGEWAPGLIDVTGWNSTLTCLMDAAVPSRRSLRAPYADADHSDFQYYLTDGFIVSANVQVESVQTQDLGFAVSDHNPVVMKCVLTGEPAQKKTVKKKK